MSYEIFAGVVDTYGGKPAVCVEGNPLFLTQGMTLEGKVVGLRNNDKIVAIRPAGDRNKEGVQVNSQVPKNQRLDCIDELSKHYHLTDLRLSTVFGPYSNR